MTTVSRVKTKNNKIEIFFFDNERLTVCFAYTVVVVGVAVVVVVVVVEPETLRILVQTAIEILSH